MGIRILGYPNPNTGELVQGAQDGTNLGGVSAFGSEREITFVGVSPLTNPPILLLAGTNDEIRLGPIGTRLGRCGRSGQRLVIGHSIEQRLQIVNEIRIVIVRRS